MTRLSAVIITKNEERALAEALASVAFCDEIVVVDSGSSDGTTRIARETGARVIVHEPWPGWVAQRNLAVSEAAHDWVLAVDADERISEALRDEIIALRDRGFEAAAYRIPRVAFYLGRWIRATDWYPDYQIRLFDRRRGRWAGGLVHESIEVDGPVATLGSDMIHYPFVDVADHIRKINSYTTLWAEQTTDRPLWLAKIQLIVGPVWTFWRNWIVRRGFLLGLTGFTISVLNSYYAFAKLAKLVERGRGRGREEAPPSPRGARA